MVMNNELCSFSDTVFVSIYLKGLRKPWKIWV